jgi:predicted porin
MKYKNIFLVSVVAVGAAHAQSSVSIFGVADVAITNGSGSISDKTQMLGAGGYAANRIGFRGTEDLGGGLASNFWLEAGMNMDAGSGAPTNTNNQATGSLGGGGLTFNRRSTLSLSGGFGEVRVGRDYTPHFINIVRNDPFGVTGAGTSQLLLGPLGMAIAGSGTNATVVRASNSLSYFLPNTLGGLYGQVMYYMGQNPSSAPNHHDGNGASVRVGYAAGPFDVAYAQNNTSYEAGDLKQSNLAASYKFGDLKFIGSHSNDKAGSISGKGYLIGSTMMLGSNEFRASYSRYSTNAKAAKPTTGKLALGYAYLLSKRTRVYATYAQLQNSGGASTALNGATTGVNESSRGFDIGISHSF